MADKKTPQVVYYRESAVQSIIADVVTFGLLAVLLTLNTKVWGDHWPLTALIVLFWFVWLGGRANAKKRDFYSFDEAIKFLQAEKVKQIKQYPPTNAKVQG